MRFKAKSINRKTARNLTKGLDNSKKIHFYRAIILYNSIYLNKDINLISEFKLLSDVGYSGRFNGMLNKACNLVLLNCAKDILFLEFASLHKIKNNTN